MRRLQGLASSRSGNRVTWTYCRCLSGRATAPCERSPVGALALGDEKARSLGVNATAARLIVVAAASLATAAAVSVSGLIGFVGIVVPHMVRRLVGTGYRLILPMSLVSGAVFLVVVDIGARTVIAPAELPLGVVTAFLGAPFFLVILRTTRSRGT